MEREQQKNNGIYDHHQTRTGRNRNVIGRAGLLLSIRRKEEENL
jgi:hypothetical protein